MRLSLLFCLAWVAVQVFLSLDATLMGPGPDQPMDQRMTSSYIATASSLMGYSLPLMAVRTVMRQGSAASMDGTIAWAGLANSALFLTFGLMVVDRGVVITGAFGTTCSLLQLLVICLYTPVKKRDSI